MHSRIIGVSTCLLMGGLLLNAFIPEQAISAPAGGPNHITADTTKKDSSKFVAYKGLPSKPPGKFP